MLRSRVVVLALVALGATSCYRWADPRVQAAEDFRSTVFGLIGEDEAQTKRLNSLRMGMADSEVLTAAGPPTTREGSSGESGRSRETWTYNGQLSTVGTLVFEDGKLVDIKTY